MPLLLIALAVLALLILMIVFRLNAFLALILVALGLGIAEGMPVKDAITSVQNGIGSTLGSIALIIGFGSMLGTLISDSGAAQRISLSLIKKFGIRHIQWAMILTGFVVGLPMFYNAGFILLIPLVFSIAASTGLPLLYVGIPMAAALSVTHGYLPPHPGPTSIAVIYKADMGLTLIYGLIVAVPAIIIAGPIFTRFLTKYKASPPAGLAPPRIFTNDEMPGYGVSFFTAVFPVLLMAVATLANAVLPVESTVRKTLDFVGDPAIALLLSVFVALYTLGLSRGRKMDDLMSLLTGSVSSIAMIMLIIGGGGALKQVLVDSGVGNYITALVRDMSLSPLVLAWSIAALLRVCLGSATVAAITTAGITLPMIAATGASPELMVLSTGAGSLMFSHVNDPGFWMFKEYFSLSIADTIATWSIMETLVSVIGLLGVLGLNAFIG
ncbi:gluconate:H+ symporter [Rufibacter latericius]|uniref:Gluconate transporter n=1 Tax=Rufibacter latericius TaxID=2487040 RepID=A0A3M9MT73_9BACT|nr:gluconate:H+ symporter [Rufibacter latericius]RNI28724.1 gluconate transporter [Rufibacter latericius]